MRLSKLAMLAVGAVALNVLFFGGIFYGLYVFAKYQGWVR